MSDILDAADAAINDPEGHFDIIDKLQSEIKRLTEIIDASKRDIERLSLPYYTLRFVGKHQLEETIIHLAVDSHHSFTFTPAPPDAGGCLFAVSGMDNIIHHVKWETAKQIRKDLGIE